MVHIWQGDLYISFSMTIFHLSFLNVEHMHCLYFKKGLQKAALQRVLWTRRRKSLHSAFSKCLISVVWGPVKVFVFKSDVYQGTDLAVIIITRLSEMSCRARTCVWWETSKVLCLFSRLPKRTFPCSWNVPRQSKAEWEDYQQRDESFHSNYRLTSNRTEASLKISTQNNLGAKKQMSEVM